MPAAPRDRAPGIHHVWVNATGNWPYFASDVDRMAWIELVVATTRRYDWRTIAFCQMTTHVHAIFDIPDESLPAGMQRLNLEYSRGFNARNERLGAFVRKRYGSRRIIDGTDLLGVYPYVVTNAAVEGLCPGAEDWRWSSYATTCGLSRDFLFVDATPVLAELGGSVEALRRLVVAQQARYLARRARSS